MAENLFSSFPGHSRAEWESKLEADLKGRPVEDLRWHLNEDISLEPFYHPEDRPQPRGPLWVEPGWQIGEYVTVRDQFGPANERLLDALQGGVVAPIVRFRKKCTPEIWKQVMNGVKPEMINLHLEELYSQKQPLHYLELMRDWIGELGVAKGDVRGSIDFDAILDWSEPPFGRLAEAITFCEENLPGFRCVQVNGREFHNLPTYVDRELALTLSKTASYFDGLKAEGVSPERVAARMQFSMSVGTSYFVEIAKLRAFRILFAHLAKAYGLPVDLKAELMVHFALESQTEDPNTNMIQAGPQVMSAVMGGADMVYVLPANASLKERSTTFYRRIARNVQHMLVMEAHLDRVADPLAGSYFIEELTDKLATQAWSHFQAIEADGGYLESTMV